jgi:hypothetical protein
MKRLMLAGLCLSLGACMTVGPDYELPKEAAIQRTDLNGPLRQDADSVVSAPVPEDWWQLYHDPRLNALVRQALSANTELRVAAANIAKARAQVDIAESQGGFDGGVKLGQHRRGDHQRVIPVRPVGHLQARHRGRQSQCRCSPSRSGHGADHAGGRCGQGLYPGMLGQRGIPHCP